MGPTRGNSSAFTTEFMVPEMDLDASLKLLTFVQTQSVTTKIMISIVLVAITGALLFLVWQNPTSRLPDTPKPLPLNIGMGGTGGSPTVTGNNNIVIGGPGGPGGATGIGGSGGGGIHTGSNMSIAGGAGGAAGDSCVWRHPAKSGYEVHQKALGLPLDPSIRAYGRGGAVPGYEPKLAIIKQMRAEYFRNHNKEPQAIFQDIYAVPLEYLNDSLAKSKEKWRVRIVDEDEYEFFSLDCHP